jgi:hypothetical protein
LPTAGQGALALNYKVIEIAQRNVNSGFTLVKSLAAAKNLPEVGCLLAQSVGRVYGQAEQLRALSTNLAADTVEPIKSHVTRGMNERRKASRIRPST